MYNIEQNGVGGARPVHRNHVLLVEDEVNVANGLKMILDDAGYDVDVALDGQKALSLFQSDGIDLVVSDLRLPDIDGMEVVREMKTIKPDLDVIIITGYPSMTSAIDSGKLGVREYLRKPFSEDEFMEAVNKALQEREEVSFERFFERTKEGRLIQKREVIRVLDRTANDLGFWRELMEIGSGRVLPVQRSQGSHHFRRLALDQRTCGRADPEAAPVHHQTA